jgi:ketosteroid isomerase-like protein
MTLAGKGIYVWRLNRIARGHVPTMVSKARDAGLAHVLIKVADGTEAYNGELLPSAVEGFHGAGIQVWGWAWIWLREPENEATVAAQLATDLGLDGFIVDAEHPAKGHQAESELYMQVLRDRVGAFPIGLSSYRYPAMHTTLPWETFLSRCDWNLPQMYWIDEVPADCFNRSLAQHMALPAARPVVPTGAAYGETYGNLYFRAEPAEITAFLDAVRGAGLAGANFWSWDWTEMYGPDLWQAIAGYEWPAAVENLPDAAERFWAALTAGDLEAIPALYHDNAVYVSAGQMVQGPEAIQSMIAELLRRLPEATFVLDELRTEGNVRFLRWSASSAAGRVEEGLETIGVRAGRIQYHSSTYHITPLA